jgi:pantoate--beta-alanine ligase
MSSRNVHLNPAQRRQALCLSQSLNLAGELVNAGTVDCAIIIEAMKAVIEKQPDARIDYISIVDNDLLQPINRIDRAALVALAVHIGSVRLIDNITVDPAAKNI